METDKPAVAPLHILLLVLLLLFLTLVLGGFLQGFPLLVPLDPLGLGPTDLLLFGFFRRLAQALKKMSQYLVLPEPGFLVGD